MYEYEEEMTLLKKLTDKFGPLQSTNGVITRPDGSEISIEEVNKAKSDAAKEVQYLAVKEEATRRIMVVTKSLFTQINIAMFLATSGSKRDALTQMAKRVVAWIDQTRMTARKLKNNPQYREDHLWPTPPDGFKEFIDRF